MFILHYERNIYGTQWWCTSFRRCSKVSQNIWCKWYHKEPRLTIVSHSSLSLSLCLVFSLRVSFSCLDGQRNRWNCLMYDACGKWYINFVHVEFLSWILCLLSSCVCVCVYSRRIRLYSTILWYVSWTLCIKGSGLQLHRVCVLYRVDLKYECPTIETIFGIKSTYTNITTITQTNSRMNPSSTFAFYRISTYTHMYNSNTGQSCISKCTNCIQIYLNSYGF